jgi:hypothetical protein
MERNRENKCLTCKWGVLGKFSPRYGGCPIGCNKQDDRALGKSCYEAKEEKDV